MLKGHLNVLKLDRAQVVAFKPQEILNQLLNAEPRQVCARRPLLVRTRRRLGLLEGRRCGARGDLHPARR